MKKKFLLLSTIIFCFLLVGCRTKVIIKDKAELNEIEGVSMTIKKETLTKESATVVITDSNKEKYFFGESFRIDKKENGSWQEVKKIGAANFNMRAYKVDKDNQLELKQNWQKIYGKLKNGEYRIVKEGFLENQVPIIKDSDLKYFSVEFIIK